MQVFPITFHIFKWQIQLSLRFIPHSLPLLSPPLSHTCTYLCDVPISPLRPPPLSPGAPGAQLPVVPASHLPFSSCHPVGSGTARFLRASDQRLCSGTPDAPAARTVRRLDVRYDGFQNYKVFLFVCSLRMFI